MHDKTQTHRLISPTEGPTIIDAPRLGSGVTIILLVGMALTCFYVVKQGILIYDITHFILPGLGCVVILAVWIAVFIQVISHRIKLDAGEIVESSLCHSKPPIVTAEIQSYTTQKHYSRGGNNGRNWNGELIFHMKDGSERKIIVSSKIFYMLEDEIKKRYRFLQS